MENEKKIESLIKLVDSLNKSSEDTMKIINNHNNYLQVIMKHYASLASQIKGVSAESIVSAIEKEVSDLEKNDDSISFN